MKSSQLAQIFVLVLVFSSSSIHRIFGHAGDDEEDDDWLRRSRSRSNADALAAV